MYPLSFLYNQSITHIYLISSQLSDFSLQQCNMKLITLQNVVHNFNMVSERVQSYFVIFDQLCCCPSLTIIISRCQRQLFWWTLNIGSYLEHDPTLKSQRLRLPYMLLLFRWLCVFRQCLLFFGVLPLTL